VNRLYVAGKGTSHITALDGSTCAIKQMIKTNGPVYGMFLAITGSSGTNGGTGNQLWYSTASALNIFQLPDKIQSIAIPAGPRYLTIPAGATVYATTRQDTVIAVSSQTLQVVSQPLLSGGNFGPWTMTPSPVRSMCQTGSITRSMC
jgi:hypothetical protein